MYILYKSFIGAMYSKYIVAVEFDIFMKVVILQGQL